MEEMIPHYSTIFLIILMSGSHHYILECNVILNWLSLPLLYNKTIFSYMFNLVIHAMVTQHISTMRETNKFANLISKLNFYKLIPYPMDNSLSGRRGPARQTSEKDVLCLHRLGRPSTVHSPDGVSYFLPV